MQSVMGLNLFSSISRLALMLGQTFHVELKNTEINVTMVRT